MPLLTNLGGRTQAEALEIDDVYLLDRLTHGTAFDDRTNDALEAAIDSVRDDLGQRDHYHEARLGIRLIVAAAIPDHRIGRIAVLALMHSVGRVLHGFRSERDAYGKHGRRPRYSVGRHAK